MGRRELPSGQPSRWIWGWVAAAALLPYLRLVPLPLVYDAPAATLRNEAVQSGSPAGVFRVDFWGVPLDAEHSSRSYRPLVSLSWVLQIRALGNAPAAFHVVDLALHALAALLVVLVGEALGLRRWWAVAAGALFAVHPVQTEAVSSVVGRADVLAGLFLFAGVLLHLRASLRPRPGAWEAAAWSCIAASMLCKEYAVAFPFVLVGIDVARAGNVRAAAARRWPFWIAVAALVAAYLALRVGLTGALGGVPMLAASDHPLVGAPLLTRFSTAARLLVLALRLLVLPVGLNHHYRAGTIPVVESPLPGLALTGAALAIASLAAAWWWARRRREPLPLVGWLFVFLPLLPALNLLTLAGVLFAERFLYVPVAGLALFTAWVGARSATRAAARRAALAVLGALIGVCVLLAARRVEQWRSDERLARSSLAVYPRGSEVWRDLGLAVGAEGRHAEALAAFERSLELEPRAPQTWKAYATALHNLGRHEDAAEAWRRCIELTPGEVGALSRGLAEALLYAGRERLGRGDAPGALRLVGELACIEGLPADLLATAGRVALSAGDAELGRRCAGRALASDPELPRELHRVALSLEQQDRLDDAAEVHRTILLLRPDHPPTLFNLGRVLLLAGRPAEAIEPLSRGIELQPDARADELLRQALEAAGPESRGP